MMSKRSVTPLSILQTPRVDSSPTVSPHICGAGNPEGSPEAPGIRAEQLQPTDGPARCLPQRRMSPPFHGPRLPAFGTRPPRPTAAPGKLEVPRKRNPPPPRPLRSLSSPRNFVQPHPERTCRRPPLPPSPEEEKKGCVLGSHPPPPQLAGHPTASPPADQARS